jgi:hypothetical protein
MRIAVALCLILLFRAGPAAADLYRWVDPESGSVKFSSYPPPWYGDEVKQRHAPKVEVIPSTVEPVAKPEAPAVRQEGSAPRREPQAPQADSKKPATGEGAR